MSDSSRSNYGRYSSASNPRESSEEPRRDRYGRRIPAPRNGHGQSRSSNPSRPEYSRSDSNNSSLDPEDSISSTGSDRCNRGGRSNQNLYGGSSRHLGPESYGYHVGSARQNVQAWSLQHGANRQPRDMTIGEWVVHTTPQNNPTQNRRRRPPSESSSESSAATSDRSRTSTARDESTSGSESGARSEASSGRGSPSDEDRYNPYYGGRQRQGQQYRRGYSGYGGYGGAQYGEHDW